MIYINIIGWRDVGGGPYSGPDSHIQAPNGLPSHCWTSLIWGVDNLTSEVSKGILDGFSVEVNEFYQCGLFVGKRL